MLVIRLVVLFILQNYNFVLSDLYLISNHNSTHSCIFEIFVVAVTFHRFQVQVFFFKDCSLYCIITDLINFNLLFFSASCLALILCSVANFLHQMIWSLIFSLQFSDISNKIIDFPLLLQCISVVLMQKCVIVQSQIIKVSP